MKTDGPGLCCYPCSSFIGRYVPPADVRSAGVPQCPLKRCTLDNYIAPALFFKVAKRGCLLRLFFYWGKLALASLLDL